MSQEKVDKYKEQKANRKKIMRKEKMMHRVRQSVVGVIGVLLIGWLGFSAYGMYENSRPKKTVEIDYDAITQYQSDLAAEKIAE